LSLQARAKQSHTRCGCNILYREVLTKKREILENLSFYNFLNTKEKRIMKRENFPSPIKEIINRLFKKVGIEKKIKEEEALKIWDEVVGKTIARHTYPFSIKKGNLFVKVDNSGWLSALTYLKDEIISKFNQRQGKDLIKNIYLKLGVVRKKRGRKRNFPRIRRVKLDEKELNNIENSLKKIKSYSFYRIVRRILIKDRKLKKRNE